VGRVEGGVVEGVRRLIDLENLTTWWVVQEVTEPIHSFVEHAQYVVVIALLADFWMNNYAR